MRGFAADGPMMLGFLMDCVAAAIRNRERVEELVEEGEIRLPRMADFGAFVEGAASKLGLGFGEFSTLIEHEQTDMQVDAAQSHPLGAALLKYFSKAGAKPIDAPAREVLTRLKAELPDQDWWPAVNKLGNELRRIAVGLRLLGIEVTTSGAAGHDNVLKYSIHSTAQFFVRKGSPREPF
jgi:hypothetical protein